MINVHLNGDVVRCPDIANILVCDREIKDNHHICRYNIKETDCEVWKQSISAWQKFNDIKPRCILAGCDLCPGHQKRTELGKSDKNFKIDNAIYRKMASSAMYMYNESKSKTLFLTLTFPEFKKNEYNHLLILTESQRKTLLNEINKSFSKFVENLRTNYGCEGYVAVREFGSRTNRVHFHIVCSLPFVSFARLNSAWCHAISDLSVYSKRAVTSDPETRIIRRNPARAIHYICKYFSKCKGQLSSTKLVFISNNVIAKAKQMDAPLETLLDSFKFDYMKQTSDYTTCYRITDNKEFNRYCEKFLFAFYELSVKKSQSLYTFPVNSS